MTVDAGLLELLPFLLLLAFVWQPKTWTPGELVTASSMNTNIRDHLNETLRASSTTVTGVQNNFALDGPFAYLKCNNASALELTGALIDGGNVSGARVYVEAFQSTVTLRHLSTGSASTNRFENDSATDIVLAPGERALMLYDSVTDLWRVGRMSTGVIAQTLGAMNLCPDPYFLIWPAGDSAAPVGGIVSGDGNSSIARNTATPAYGDMCVQINLGNTATASASCTFTIVPNLPARWRDTFVGIGCDIRVPGAQTNLAKLEVDDGGTGGTSSSPFQTDGDQYQWISFSHKFSGDAVKLNVKLTCDIAAQEAGIISALFDGLTITIGPQPPSSVIATPSIEGTLYYRIRGNAQVLVDDFRFNPSRPMLVRNVSLRANTAPTGAALIVDCNHWDGVAYQSMFGATKPQIAAGATKGGREPDGTYRYRCFAGGRNVDVDTDRLLNLDVDQIGSTVPGADVEVMVHTLQFVEPLRALMDF